MKITTALGATTGGAQQIETLLDGPLDAMLRSQDLLFNGGDYATAELCLPYAEHYNGSVDCAPLEWHSSDLSQEWLDIEECQLNTLQHHLECMRGTNSLLQTRLYQVDQEIDSAIQEHMRLRKTVTALQQYKRALQIQPPQESQSGRSSAAEPFSKWLQEDPAEAFLTFEQDFGGASEEGKPATAADSGHRRAQSAPIHHSTGCIGMQEKQSNLPGRLELDPEFATTAAVAAAALAHNNGNCAAAMLDLVQLAIVRASAKERSQSTHA